MKSNFQSETINNFLKQKYDLSKYNPIHNDRVCVIIEPRIIDNLNSIIENIMFYTNWYVIAYINSAMYDKINPIVERRIVDDMDLYTYNSILLSDFFWEEYYDDGFNQMLIFQSDSFLVNDNIDYFADLNLDYIGASWKWAYDTNKYEKFRNGGNGGLSLRNIPKMLEITKNMNDEDKKYNEDMAFSLKMKQQNDYLEIQNIFSSETYLNNSLGYHAIDKYHKEEDINGHFNKYI